MAQDGEVNVKVKVTAENGGVTKVESGLDKVGKKAEETAKKTKSGFEQANQTFGKVTKAAGAFQKVLSGFGMIGIATALVGGIKKIIDSFRSAKKEAEEFNKAAAEKKVKDGIDALADSYKQLTDAIARANAERTAQNEIDSIELKNKRDIEDANIDLAEQKELDAIDAEDPAAAEARAEIQARYKAKRDNLAVQRGIFDGVRERQELRQGAMSDRESAGQIDAAAAATEQAIREAEARRNAAQGRANSENGEDATGFWSAFGNNVKNIVSLDWGKVGETRTEAGDEERKKAQAEADAEQARIDQLKKEAEAQRKQAEDLRTSATQKDRKAEALGGSYEAQKIRGQVVSMQGAASIAAAERATDKKDEDVAKEKAKEADAMQAQELLRREKAELEQRIAAEQARKATAAQGVFAAQGNLDLAKLNKSGQAGAQQALISAQQAADGVNREADAALKTLTETLKNVESRLKAAQSFLESQSKQQRNAWSEAPSGE